MRVSKFVFVCRIACFNILLMCASCCWKSSGYCLFQYLLVSLSLRCTCSCSSACCLTVCLVILSYGWPRFICWFGPVCDVALSEQTSKSMLDKTNKHTKERSSKQHNKARHVSTPKLHSQPCNAPSNAPNHHPRNQPLITSSHQTNPGTTKSIKQAVTTIKATKHQSIQP